MKNYGELLENESLKKYNTYKIGGKAKYLIKPYNISSLKKFLQYLNNKKIKYLLLGKGSNVILPDENYNGVVILLDKLNKIEIKDNLVSVEAGTILNDLINKCINNNLGGLENLYGIPGTVGGAIVGNAGCNKSEISDNLIEITYLKNGNIITKNKKDCLFEYRKSEFKNKDDIIILSAKFLLEYKDKEDMKQTIKNNIIKRKENQPLEYPNAGSVFKNPINNSAGKLIDKAGLKNYNVGGAFISDKHANFIINKNCATSKDILNLIEYVKKEILKKYNINLELEQIIIKYD